MKRLILILLLFCCSIGSAQTRPSWHQLKDNPFVSVTSYGAVGNGTVDDSAAIQAATNTGKAVYFPDGIYKAKGIAYAGKVVWVGSGNAKIISDESVLQVTGGSDSLIDNLRLENITPPWIITRDPASWGATVTATQSNALGYQPTVNDKDIWSSLTTAQQNQNIGPTIRFVGDAENITVSRITGRFVSIMLYDTTNSIVRDCNFRAGKNSLGGIVFWNIDGQAGYNNRAISNFVTHPSFSGIIFARNSEGLIQGNTVEFAGESGIKTYQNDIGSISARCYKMKILDNSAKYCYYDGFDLSADYPHTGTTSTSHQIIGNKASNIRNVGFYADGMSNQVVGNVTQSTGLSGLYLTYSNSQIDSNLIVDCNTRGAVTGHHQISIVGESNRVTNNLVRQVNPAGYGIYCPGNNYVANNTLATATLFVGSAGSITATTFGNESAAGLPLTSTKPQGIRQEVATIPALTLYSEISSYTDVDAVFHPRRNALANPIASLKGTVTYGSSGSEAGVLAGYAAASGTLLPGWRIQTNGALPDKAFFLIYTPNAVLADAWLQPGTLGFSLDELSNTLRIKAKYSNGTVASATISLSVP